MSNIPIILLSGGIIINSIITLIITKHLTYRIDEVERKRDHLYHQLADPDRILEEMEKGARLREMHDANRTTLPRDDATGQNARVFRPRMRSKLPSRWNPPPA